MLLNAFLGYCSLRPSNPPIHRTLHCGCHRQRLGHKRVISGQDLRSRRNSVRRLPPLLKASSSELEEEALRETPVLDRIHFGAVTRVFSQEELDILFKEFPNTLMALKCKAKYCRPCSAFAKRYMRFAEEFPDVLFLEIVGDENKQTRMMMVDFEVKATPTFRYYLDGECVTVTVGIKQEKLRDAIHFFRPQETSTPHDN